MPVMNKNNNLKYIVLGVFLITVLTSCGHKESEYHSLIDKIEAKSKLQNNTGASIEKDFNHIEMIDVEEDGRSFLIPERKNQIKSFACSECHTVGLEQLKSKEQAKNAHWDIKMDHADNSTMNCVTCHNMNDMNTLKSLTTNIIDFNHSYKLCSQCHSKQYTDWKGGAHGKNIGGWTNPRAAYACVNCHNPHDPHFESRWPARFNTQIEIERK